MFKYNRKCNIKSVQWLKSVSKYYSAALIVFVFAWKVFPHLKQKYTLKKKIPSYGYAKTFNLSVFSDQPKQLMPDSEIRYRYSNGTDGASGLRDRWE